MQPKEKVFFGAFSASCFLCFLGQVTVPPKGGGGCKGGGGVQQRKARTIGAPKPPQHASWMSAAGQGFLAIPAPKAGARAFRMSACT